VTGRCGCYALCIMQILCNFLGLEDVLELSNGASTTTIQNNGYDVAVTPSKKNNLCKY
jgi:hypothetical protein